MGGSSLFFSLARGGAELAEHHPYSILEQSKAQKGSESSKVPSVTEIHCLHCGSCPCLTLNWK